MTERIRITLEDNTGNIQNYGGQSSSASVSKGKNRDSFRFVTGVDNIERKNEFPSNYETLPNNMKLVRVKFIRIRH